METRYEIKVRVPDGGAEVIIFHGLTEKDRSIAEKLMTNYRDPNNAVEYIVKPYIAAADGKKV